MKDAWWWHEGYAHTYVMFQKLSRPHAGPLNIYDPKHWPLMISWMSLVGPKFDWWPLCQSWRADLMDITISIARLVMLVRTPVRLQRVRRCVNHSLRRLGAPPMAKIILKVPLPVKCFLLVHYGNPWWQPESCPTWPNRGSCHRSGSFMANRRLFRASAEYRPWLGKFHGQKF